MSDSPDKFRTETETPANAAAFTDAEREVLTFLHNSKRVDLRWLSEEQRQKLKTVLNGLHNEKRISLFRISKEVGKSYNVIWGLCRALQIHTRNVSEASTESAASRSKHKRTSFAGSAEEGAYMVGFKNGDLTAWQVSGTAVMVTSSTTHPAFADLFHQLFQTHSHVYQYPMFEEGKGYKWKVAVRLDNSFKFLLKSAQEAAEEFASERPLFVSWLAGLIDSDGNTHTSENNGHPRVRVITYNSNTLLLDAIVRETRKIGYEFDGPYLLKKKGTVTPFGIRYKKDLWQIALQQTASAQRLLAELPIRHSEKAERKLLALQVGNTEWNEIDARLTELKVKIKADVIEFCRRAEEGYVQKQKGRNRKATANGPMPLSD
jgi:hypothetical protein